MRSHKTFLGPIGLLACSLAVFLVVPAAASAQGFGPSRYDFNTRQVQGPLNRPTFSPYLNLLRNDNYALNYYGLVRPELDIRANENRLESNLSRLDDRLTKQQNYSGNTSQFGRSGHRSQFMVDLRGRPENIPMDMRDRRLQSNAQMQQFGRVRPSTGHSAYYGNGGSYYPTRGN